MAVADHAGGHWAARARTAVVTLTAEADDDQASSRVRLLADCRTAFGDESALPTAVLLDRLKADLDAPWADYGPTGLAPAKLSVHLREFDIRPGNIRFPDGTQAKGYRRADFSDAWIRYCPRARLASPGRLDRPREPIRPSRISTGTHGTTGTASRTGR